MSAHDDKDDRPAAADGGTPRGRAWRYAVWAAAATLIAVYWVSLGTEERHELTYTELKQAVRAESVARVEFEGETIRGRFVEPRPLGADATGEGTKPGGTGEGGAAGEHGAAGEGGDGGPFGLFSGPAATARFVSTRPPVEDPELMPLLEEHQVEVAAEPTRGSWWLQALIGVAPWLLLIGLVWWFSIRMQRQMAGGGGGPFSFGKSKARRFERSESQVGFDDVAGLEHAKHDLQQIIAYLKDPKYYEQLGAKVPRGLLLMGPPGTGKTLLARAVAGEAQVPFFSISGSEFIEMFVGVGASRVRDMFESAKREAPAIIFIDEIDSIGRARGAGLGGGHDEREQTLNQILGEMDGFAPHEAVVVLAATNRPDVLDPALLRPGRFDRKITLELPDKEARGRILGIHVRDVPLAEDVDLERVAALTVGFSAADLENLVNEAALSAGGRRSARVEMADLLDARDKVVLGTERHVALEDEEKRIIAYHEAGHALAASLLPHADRPDKVTIVPRSGALGATEQLPEEERHNLQEAYLRARLGVALAGRAAERLIFGETSTGAEQDLKQATRLARRMVTHWGMSEALGPVAFRRGEDHVFLGREMAQQQDYSESTAELIDAELRELLRGVAQRVEQLLEANRRALDRLAERLLEAETLEREEIDRVLEEAAPAGGGPQRDASRRPA